MIGTSYGPKFCCSAMVYASRSSKLGSIKREVGVRRLYVQDISEFVQEKEQVRTEMVRLEMLHLLLSANALHKRARAASRARARVFIWALVDRMRV
eukprot:6206005-Pleurochrysis_carterae.AAC.3